MERPFRHYRLPHCHYALSSSILYVSCVRTALAQSISMHGFSLWNRSPSPRDVHPPKSMMHYSLFQIPPLFRICQSQKRFPNFIKKCRFRLPKFLMTFLVIDSIYNFPIFSRKRYTILPHISANVSLPPTFVNFPPDFVKFTCFFTYFVCFSFLPYFDHDAFIHRTMYVLDAPALPVCSTNLVGLIFLSPQFLPILAGFLALGALLKKSCFISGQMQYNTEI